jgi:DNA-nicking Smr family endonuclease
MEALKLMPGKKKTALSGSMNQLKDLVNKAGIRLISSENQPVQAAPIPPKLEAVQEKPPEESDDKLFEAAMNAIEQVAWKHDPHPSTKPPRVPSTNREAEDRRLMQEAMNEEVPLVIPNHPEYIEGWIGVAGKLYLPHLRNGLYSVQGQIDLHGMNQSEAQIAVEEYIIQMSRIRPCCIKIIHGRGINSPYDRAILKESLQRLLTTRKMSRYVLAYASASPHDGGVGAVYVLLSQH